MTVDEPRYVASRRGDVWWSIWDTVEGRWLDERRWLASLYPAMAASRLNHDVPEAGDMSTSDGLGV